MTKAKFKEKDLFELNEHDKAKVHAANLDPEVKAKWVAALRSGEYPQGAGHLKVQMNNEPDPRFCCLGVLCDVEGMELHRGAEFIGMDGEEEGIAYYIKGSTIDSEPMASESYLPSAFAQQAGLLDVDILLASFNDMGASFDEIADWIEANL